MLDAVGRAIEETGRRLEVLAEHDRPEFVIMLIITDGDENSSVEFTKAQIKKKISHQTDVYKWHFSYLGANQDSFKEARSMGIPVFSTLDFDPTPIGVQSMYLSVSNATSALRSHQTETLNYTQSDDLSAGKV